MPSVMAIVSKAVFEKQARVDGRRVEPGDVWPVDAYNSAHKALNPLGAGGSLFLVTARPGDALWLVAVLESPTFDQTRWSAAANVVAVRDVSAATGGLRFSTGKGITAKPGALGMSLQTPRVLTADDEALLRGTGGAPAPKKATPKKAAPKKTKARASKASTAKAPAGASPVLSEAFEALRADNLVRGLDRLVDAWGGHRAAETAALIERVGALVDRSLDPIEGKEKSSALDEAWTDVASQRRAADVPRLAACFEAGSTPMLKRWFAQLLDFRPDPRLAVPPVSVTERYRSTGDATPRTAAFKLATHVADGRQLATLDGVVQRADNLAGNVKRLRKVLVEPPALSEADAAVAALIDAELGRLAALDPPDAEAMFAAAAEAGDATEQSLVDAVLAAPDDDGPRLVYADWLAQRGDPRAELLMLQLGEKLTGKQQKRVRELVKQHSARWIFPLDAVVQKPRFERGFLGGCGAVSFSTDKQRDELCAHPLWATVREIDACNEPRLLRGDALRSLRSLSCGADTLAAIAAKPNPLALEHVSTSYFDAERFVELAALHRRRWRIWQDELEPDALAARSGHLRHWKAIGKIGALTKLRRLDLRSDHGIFQMDGGAVERFDWLTQSALAKKLEHITLDNHDTGVQLGGWLDLFDTLPRLQRLDLLSSPNDYYNSPNWSGPTHACNLRFIATREADARRLELVIDWPYYRDKLRPIDKNFAIALQGFPRAELPELVVRYSKRKSGVDVARLGEVAQMLTAHFERVVAPDGTVLRAP